MENPLLPARCAICRRTGAGLCWDCAATLAPAPDLPPPLGLDRCASLLAYDGSTVDLVKSLKYRNHRDAAKPLGRALAHLVAALLDAGPLPDSAGPVRGQVVLTWAPTSRQRVRDRGFDQARLLARVTARAAALPVSDLLDRLPGPPQTGRDRARRLEGPSFRARKRAPGTVVVVDDVRTTGATLAAAAAALRHGGAGRVLGLTLAVRP